MLGIPRPQLAKKDTKLLKAMTMKGKKKRNLARKRKSKPSRKYQILFVTQPRTSLLHIMYFKMDMPKLV